MAAPLAWYVGWITQPRHGSLWPVLLLGPWTQSMSLERYLYAKELLELPADHPIHEAEEGDWGGPFPAWKSDPTNPLFGHVMERAWSVIFNCHSMRLAEQTDCEEPGMVGSQCLDDVDDSRLTS